METGDVVLAVQAFHDAYEATKSTRYLWNLALAEIKADRPAEALTHLRWYLKRDDASPQNLARARPLVERLRKDVGSLLVTAPEGADVLVDGALVGQAPLGGAVEIDPDKAHVVEARLAGASAQGDVKPPGATTVQLTLAFAPSSPGASPPPPAPLAPPPVPAGAPSDPPHPAGAPKESLLTGLVLTELAAGAISAGVGCSLLADAGNATGTRIVGASLVGAGVLFFAADLLTLTLWPRGDAPSTTALATATLAPALVPGAAGVSVRGAF